MSLIADALKKAQASKLARRYVTTKPTGVLPVVADGTSGGVRASFGSFFKTDQRPMTLVVGLVCGGVFFLVLFFYFFYGPGRNVGSTSARNTIGAQRTSQNLVLSPPPAAMELEPLRFNGEPQVALETPPRVVPAKVPSLATRKQKNQSPYPGAQTNDAQAGDIGRSSVSVTSEISEEVRSRFNLALFYHESKNFDRALAEYEKVIQLWPLYAEAYNNLGLVYKELGMHTQAIVRFKQALKLNPNYTRAYHNLGVIHHLSGDLKEAKEYYLKALTLDRNNLSSLNNLGLVYREEERFREARILLERALTVKPNAPQTQYNLALVLEELGELEGARTHYQRFVSLSGQENQALAQRVKAHLENLARGTN